MTTTDLIGTTYSTLKSEIWRLSDLSYLCITKFEFEGFSWKFCRGSKTATALPPAQDVVLEVVFA